MSTHELAQPESAPRLKRNFNTWLGLWVIVQALPLMVGIPRLLTGLTSSITYATILLAWLTTTVTVVYSFIRYRAAVRKYPIGNYIYSSTLYKNIKAVLKSRGITNVKRHLMDHPEHTKASVELAEELYEHHSVMLDVPAIQSLIFINDGDPRQTYAAILSIVETGRGSSPEEIQEILPSFKSVPVPLADGAL